MDEELDLFLHALGERCVVRRRVGVADNVEVVHVDDDEGEHGEALLVVEVAEDAWDGFLAFAVGEDLDEGVG